jgi:phytoene dehydrogenase-like protein
VVLERGAYPGGVAGVLAARGYRIDTGPVVLTMADLVADTFAAAGADMGEHLTLQRGDPMYRASFADGSALSERPVPDGERRRPVPRLALVGMGTVPGVGIPMVPISGRLAAERVDSWGRG